MKNSCPVDQILQIFEKKDCPSIRDKSNKKIDEYAENCLGIEGHNELRLELCCRDSRSYSIWIDGLRIVAPSGVGGKLKGSTMKENWKFKEKSAMKEKDDLVKI